MLSQPRPSPDDGFDLYCIEVPKVSDAESLDAAMDHLISQVVPAPGRPDPQASGCAFAIGHRDCWVCRAMSDQQGGQALRWCWMYRRATIQRGSC